MTCVKASQSLAAVTSGGLQTPGLRYQVPLGPCFDMTATTAMCTRACAVWGYFVFLLYSSLNVCSTVKFDGSYYDGKVIWTGLCSRTLFKWSEYSNVSCLVASRTSVTRSTASRPATSQPSSTRAIISWGPTEGADRLREVD